MCDSLTSKPVLTFVLSVYCVLCTAASAHVLVIANDVTESVYCSVDSAFGLKDFSISHADCFSVAVFGVVSGSVSDAKLLN